MPLDQIDIDKDELPAEYRKGEVQKQDEGEMTFVDHLDVLRKHMLRSIAVTVAVTIVVAVFISFFFDHIIMAPTKPDFISYKALCALSELMQTDVLCLDLVETNFQNRKVSGQFTMHISASFTIGLILSFPFLIYQLWQFVKPALYTKEKSVTSGIVFFCSLLFFIGVSFAYYFVIPLTFQFFSTYSISDAIINEFDTSSYISIFVDIVLACGIMFQMPMFIYLLTKIGIIGPEFLINYRKHAFVVILVLSAILTPADVMSMILLSLPLLLLYEVSIFVSKRVQKNEGLD